jgi:hypothetical protein
MASAVTTARTEAPPTADLIQSNWRGAVFSIYFVREFYQQAADCARQADAQDDPKVKQQFLELKRLWLLLADRCEFNIA